MRIISYKLFLESSQDSIESICEMYGIKNYTINQAGSIDVDGNVSLDGVKLVKLPLKFRTVTGFFDCCDNKLTTLEGSPKSVGGVFDCQNNQLTSLEGGPKSVGGSFYCPENKLTSLIGGPEVALNTYYAYNNQINSFEGFPDDYEGWCDFSNNPVQKVLDQFPDHLWVKAIHLIIDYDAIWNGEVIPERLEMVKDKLGLI
jgi:hypothetical protein